MSTLSPLVPVPVRYPMITWFTGDVFDGLATLDDGSIDLVVTSPPFLALRSYLPADHPDKAKEIGSEATPAEFLDVMLKVTAELRRVLAPHGSIAVELGDTYSGSSMDGGDQRRLAAGEHVQQNAWTGTQPIQRRGPSPLHPRQTEGWPLAKSKTLIPELFRVALAYGFNPLTGQESPAGKWRVRNVVTWCRPNPPVGALGDKWRPATSDVVVACVSGKRYWDDLATRREHLRWPREPETGMRKGGMEASGWAGNDVDRKLGEPMNSGGNPSGAPLLDYWEIPLLDDEEPRQYGPKEPKLSQRTTNGPKSKEAAQEVQVKFDVRMESNEAGAPLLDYWEIPPTGYAGAHYAVYPPALVEPLVKAMVPERVCRTCGEPSRRIVETDRVTTSRPDKTKGPVWEVSPKANSGAFADRGVTTVSHVGFTDCGHDDWRPGIVLDPFAGSGTTLAVASGHGHDAIGFDLDPRNEELARERVGPLLWQELV